jgi:hypothetical protein
MMFGKIETLEQAKNHKYGTWAGNPKGYKYEEGRCAEEVSEHHIFFQCSRKNGHGINGLYCKQHSKHHPVKEVI